MEASRSRLRASVCGELTPRSAKAHTRPHNLASSGLWTWALSGKRAWHPATSLRQRSTYGPLSPLRCSARSWYNTDSSGTSSWLGTMDGYLEVSTAVICSLRAEHKLISHHDQSKFTFKTFLCYDFHTMV